MFEYNLAYGEKTITLHWPHNHAPQIVEGHVQTPCADIDGAVRQALTSPIGAAPLNRVVAAGQKIVVVVSDVTRQWLRYDLFLPVLLDVLNEAGVADEDISLIVALGAHRAQSETEHTAIYGAQVVRRVKIIQSRVDEEDAYRYVGNTSRGTPVSLNKAVLSADRVILTGGVTYHSMAGFGGGRKAILPGIAAYETIQANHRLCLHPIPGRGLNPTCASGALDGNPMHQDMMEIARMANPDFLLNVLMTAEGEIAGFVAGHWETAWLAGCRQVERQFGIPVTRQTEAAIVSAGGYPKDINFYQASKAIENACVAVKDGGVLIALMECRDIEEPSDFWQWFDLGSLEKMEAALRQGFTVPGFVALKLGYIAQKQRVIIVTRPENVSRFAKTGMKTASTLEEALKQCAAWLGKEDFELSIFPHAAATLPLLP